MTTYNKFVGPDGKFCGACGRPLVNSGIEGDANRKSLGSSSYAGKREPYAPEVEPEQSSTLGDKIGNMLGAIVGIPLVLLVFVISTALPVLIIVGLIRGPADTWNMIRAWVPGVGSNGNSAACDGFADWLRATNQRGADLFVVIEPMMNGQVRDPVALRAIERDIQEAISEQRQSDPPLEGKNLNTLTIDAYSILAQGTIAAAERDMVSLPQYDADYNALTPQIRAEETRAREACL